MTYQKNIKNIVCLQIIPNLGFGGVETGVKNIHNYFKLKGIKSFILCEKIIDPDYINDKSIFEVNRSFKNPLNYWLIRKKILKILISESINIVHISSRAPAFYFSTYGGTLLINHAGFTHRGDANHRLDRAHGNYRGLSCPAARIVGALQNPAGNELGQTTRSGTG